MKILRGLAEGQVLQRLGSRGASARLSGTVVENGPVVATLTGAKGALAGWKARAVGSAKGGKFEARLDKVPAGGPYRLDLGVRGTDAAVRIKSFFVGDVWLLGGQSNMEGLADLAGAARPHPLVRAFSMRREWRLATDPIHLLKESPDSCHTPVQCPVAEGEALRRTSVKGTSAGVFFGREMVQRSGVPQGLVAVSHGGTSMEQWDPAKKGLAGGSLYGSLLLSARATGQPVAGVLWYQGESDSSPEAAPLYTERMKKLVAASRRDLKQPRLPWVVVQIGRVCDLPSQANSGWNPVQEAQRLLPDVIPHLETVAAIDLPLDDGIHIGAAGFPRLAARLARAADRLVYGNRKEPRPPALREVSPVRFLPGTGFYADVTFDNVVGVLRAPGQAFGFTVVDERGNDLGSVFKTVLQGNRARVHMSRVGGAVGLCYGHQVNPICNVTDGRDMALPVFASQLFPQDPRLLPFITRWRKTGIVADAAPLASVTVDDMERHAFTPKEYFPQDIMGGVLWGFVNEREAWKDHAGQCYFTTRIELPVALDLDVLSGYDGPFRLWVDRQPFFAALDGTNPCIPDEGRKAVRLAKGVHEIHVAIDLAGGAAWGFFLRFGYRGALPKRLRGPAYLG